MNTLWVIGVAKDGHIIHHLNHPDYVFKSAVEAAARRMDALMLIRKSHPDVGILDLHVVPAREMTITP